MIRSSKSSQLECHSKIAVVVNLSLIFNLHTRERAQYGMDGKFNYINHPGLQLQFPEKTYCCD
jgi:hypothetical protein